MNRILLTFSLLIFTSQLALPNTRDGSKRGLHDGHHRGHAAHQYSGSMKVVLRNNSPESLDKAYFHLFFNAFQPGSMMDVRSAPSVIRTAGWVRAFLNCPKTNGDGLKWLRSCQREAGGL